MHPIRLMVLLAGVGLGCSPALVGRDADGGTSLQEADGGAPDASEPSPDAGSSADAGPYFHLYPVPSSAWAEITDVAVHANGELTVVGYSYPLAAHQTFFHHAGEGQPTKVLDGTGWEGWALRLTPAGRVKWVLHPGDPSDDRITSVAALGSSAVMAGGFKGSTTVGTTPLVSGGDWDGWLALVDEHGEAQWLHHFQNLLVSEVRGVKVDPQGNAYAVVAFAGELKLGGRLYSTQNGKQDSLVMKFDPSGRLQWSSALSGPWDVIARALDLDLPRQRAVVVGALHGSAQLGSTLVKSSGQADAFIALLDLQTGKVVDGVGVGGIDQDIGTLVVATDSGYTLGLFSRSSELVVPGRPNVPAPAYSDHLFAASADLKVLEHLVTTQGGARSRLTALLPLPEGAMVAGDYSGTLDWPGGAIVAREPSVFLGTIGQPARNLMSCTLDCEVRGATRLADGRPVLFGRAAGNLSTSSQTVSQSTSDRVGFLLIP